MGCIIIGGGIAGLTTAIALRQRGIEARVFEAAPELREVGAGIWMPANAMQVLDRLGIAGEVRDAGRALRYGEVHDARDGTLQALDLDAVARRFGFGTVAIHRGRLQQILARHLPPEVLHLGRPCVAVAQQNGRVAAHFGDGTEASAGVLIAADGLGSTVRGHLFPGAAVRYSGQTSYRGIAEWRLSAELEGSAREVWSAGCRFGFSAIAEHEIYWFATRDAPRGERDTPGSTLGQLASLFAAFPAPIAELLARTPEHAVTRTDICDLQPMPAWYSGRVALVGDAAHATTPNLGQGGAQAIEDAYLLAERLATHAAHPERAFREYQQARKPKVDRIVSTSWWLGKLAHVRNPIGRPVRNALIRATPARINERRFESLFKLGY